MKMQAFLALGLVLTGGPAIAASSSDNSQASGENSGRKICTRVERRSSASRLAYQRVCLTAAEWRDRLGPDWRQRLAGNDNTEDQMDGVDVRARAFTDVPTASTPQ